MDGCVNPWLLWSEKTFRKREGWEFKIDKHFVIFMTRSERPNDRLVYAARLLEGTGRKELVQFVFTADSNEQAAEKALERMRAYMKDVSSKYAKAAGAIDALLPYDGEERTQN